MFDLDHEPVIPPLFEALDGFHFHVREKVYALQAGAYASGKGALVIFCDGEPLTKLTVDLTIYEPNGSVYKLQDHEFFVKLSEDIEVSLVLEQLLRLQLFAEYPRTDIRHAADDRYGRASVVDAGYSSEYAAKWEFMRCTLHEPHTFVVLCEWCRRRLDDLFKDTEQRLLAEDTIERLKPDEPRTTETGRTRSSAPNTQFLPRFPRNGQKRRGP